MDKKQFRQGDLLFVACDRDEIEGELITTSVIQTGENTGHAHALAVQDSAALYGRNGVVEWIVPNVDYVRIVHEEHAPIEMDQVYRVIRQVERDIWAEELEAVRRVLD